MRRLVTLLAASGTLALSASAGAAPAGAGHQTASSDGWRASFTFVKTSDLQYSKLHLTVRHGAELVLDQPVRSSLPGVGDRLQPGGIYNRSSLSFRDLNADGSKELLLALYTGGAHCCFLEQVFDFAGAKPRKTEFDFADAGETVKVLGGQVVFVTRDDSFAYQFTDYADSGAPVQIWAYDGGRFTNVTRSHEPAIAKDATFWWKQYRAQVKRRGDVRGILAAWAADEALLGRACARQADAAPNRGRRCARPWVRFPEGQRLRPGAVAISRNEGLPRLSGSPEAHGGVPSLVLALPGQDSRPKPAVRPPRSASPGCAIRLGA